MKVVVENRRTSGEGISLKTWSKQSQAFNQWLFWIMWIEIRFEKPAHITKARTKYKRLPCVKPTIELGLNSARYIAGF